VGWQERKNGNGAEWPEMKRAQENVEEALCVYEVLRLERMEERERERERERKRERERWKGTGKGAGGC